MAILNTLSGHEFEATAFIQSCMDMIFAEAEDEKLMKVILVYFKSFIDSFDENEINPLLARIQKAHIPNPQLQQLKATHIAEVTNGTRTEEVVMNELPSWPLCFKNPLKIQAMFGSVPTGKKAKKGISSTTNSKIQNKINNIKTREDILYLVHYFNEFFFGKDEKLLFQEYDLFVHKLYEFGYVPKKRNDCFQIKTQDMIISDIIMLFLDEDLTKEENVEFMKSCIDRYYELYA